jgi:hypothetical protein
LDFWYATIAGISVATALIVWRVKKILSALE